MKKILLFTLTLTLLMLSACAVKNSAPSSSYTESVSNPSESSSQPEDTIQKETPVAENSGKIKAVVSKNCNYIYHMLSVSKCGYDNEYGKKYASYHSQEDLQTLKNYESYITVAGGEHTGELYTLCVSLPASLDDDVSISTYFEALIDLFEADHLEQNFEQYQDIYKQSFSTLGASIDLESLRSFYAFNEPYKKEITEISKVMLHNYSIYSDKIWETSKTELSVIADELNQQFSTTDYIGKWEELLNCKYEQTDFFAVLCNSMQGGPNCIDISSSKDVFYSSGGDASMAQLISHEFGIYLLKDILADTPAFQGHTYYKIVEGLAEYYNREVSGGHSDWDWSRAYMDFFEQLKEQEPEITAKEMFLRAADHFEPAAPTNTDDIQDA